MNSSFAYRREGSHPDARDCIEWPLLEDAEIHALATSEVFWDKIVEITSLGEMDVYDGTVDGTHNFVANRIQRT